MINVAEVVNDPDFAQAFTVQRSNGSFVKGVWKNVTSDIQAYGVIQQATEKDLEQVPAGDRARGGIKVWCSQQLYTTHADGLPGVSDIVIWHGEQYRVASLSEWQDNGYWKTIAARISGQ